MWIIHCNMCYEYKSIYLGCNSYKKKISLMYGQSVTVDSSASVYVFSCLFEFIQKFGTRKNLFSSQCTCLFLIHQRTSKVNICRYFDTLQEILEPYDCVLYEMVASRESLENRRNQEAKRKPKGSSVRGFNIIGCIQRQMAKLLVLDFQLDCLDYQLENWYHADLDFETFKLLQVALPQHILTLTVLLKTKFI